MVYGPCGGVRPDGGCEVPAAGRCVFVDRPVTTFPGPAVAARGADERRRESRQTGRPRVVTDLHARPFDEGSLREVASVLAGTCDAVLVGDHGARRPDRAPVATAELLAEMGMRPWVTLSCRNRDRRELDAECATLADLGVAGVHCVTGDWVTGHRVTRHRVSGHRVAGHRVAGHRVAGDPVRDGGDGGGDPVFDLDALRLVELAARRDLAVSVAATPGAPPAGARPARLAAKASAGAGVCFVNHCGGPTQVARFVAAARDAGADMEYVPCVPVISDPASAAALARLPGLVLDPDVVAEVGAGGSRPGAGVAAAAAEAAAMLVVPGVVGVNLSGAASTRSELESAAMMAQLGRLVRDRGGDA